LNGDKMVEPNELQIYKSDGKTLALLKSPAGYDPDHPASPVSLSTVDPNLKDDITDEGIIGVDHELLSDFGVGAMFIYRKYHQLCAGGGSCATAAVRYLDAVYPVGPIPFTASCGNSTCSQPSYTGYY